MSNLLRHCYLENTDGSSYKCYLLALVRDEAGIHHVVASYGRIGGRLSDSSKVAGVDLRKAITAYETTLGEKLRKGYRDLTAQPPRNDVIDWFIGRGASATDIWPELRGLDLEPEERAGSLPAGSVARYTFRRRLVPRGDTSPLSGRSWVTIDAAGTALIIDPETGRKIQRIVLDGRPGFDQLAPLLPLVIEGSRGALDGREATPDRRAAFTVLAEDVVRVSGRDIIELPWSERALILEEVLARLDNVCDAELVHPRSVRDRLAAEVDALLSGVSVPDPIALPVARRLDAARGEPGGRALIALA